MKLLITAAWSSSDIAARSKPRRWKYADSSAFASSAVGAMHAVFCHETVRSERSRPRASQWPANASSLRSMSGGGQMMFDSSAYWATIRSVFFSPPPPIITGMCDIGGGSLIASTTL